MKYLPGETGLSEGSAPLSEGIARRFSRASLARARAPQHHYCCPQCLGLQDRLAGLLRTLVPASLLAQQVLEKPRRQGGVEVGKGLEPFQGT